MILFAKFVLTVLFVFVLTPVAMFLRVLRHDPLGIRLRVSVNTYWIDRDSREPGSILFTRLR